MRKFAPWIISFVLLLLGSHKNVAAQGIPASMCVLGFGELPVLVDGRMVPMDMLARLTLSEMYHHGAYTRASDNTER